MAGRRSRPERQPGAEPLTVASTTDRSPDPATPPRAAGSGGQDPVWLRGLRFARWYVASIMGDNHYEQYVARMRRDHPDCPVPTEKEYWRARMDAQDTNPQNRCC